MEFWSRRRLSTNLIGLLLILLGWLVLGSLAATLVSALTPGSIWGMPIQYAVLLVVTLIVCRFYDRMPAAWVGLGLQPWTGRESITGLALGAGMAVVAWLPSALLGGVSRGEPGGGWLIWIGLISLSAAGEEILFRGYIFQRIMEMIGPAAATLLLSAGFALAHAANPNVTPMSLGVIFLGGIFFSLCYLRSGSLWLPIGAHLAWNMALGKVLGLPVSGQDFGASLLRTAVVGPDIITGGAFGPEGGAATIVALAIGIVLVARGGLVDLSPYTHARVFHAFHRRQREKETPRPLQQ